MNKKQKNILIVFIPILILICAMGIASSKGYCKSSNKNCVRAFDWERTWSAWFIAMGLIGFSEYILLKENHREE